MTEPSADRRRIRARGGALFLMSALVVGVLALSAPLGASASSTQSAAQLFKSAYKSTSAASSFSVKGSIDQPKDDIALNLTVGASGTAQGTITINGGTVRVIEIGTVAYFNADTTFWTQNAGASAAQLLAGRWVYGPTTSSPFSSFREFLSPRAFMKLFLGSASGPYTKSGATTFNGVHVVPIMADGPGTLYVGAANPHLVIGAKGSQGTTSVSLSLSGYGRPVHASKPQGGISLKGLEASGSGSSS